MATVEKVRAADLVERIRRHYIRKADFPGGVVINEVGLNKGAANYGGQRRCDVVHIGFTSSSGQMLTGHEIKISRSDWLHELDQPDKSYIWEQECHRWYVVAPRGMIKTSELPHGWGLMQPVANSRSVRLEIVKECITRTDHQPSWDIMRSIFARYDTVETRDRHIVERRLENAERERDEMSKRLGGFVNPPAPLTPDEQLARALIERVKALTRGTYTHPEHDLEMMASVLVDLAEAKRRRLDVLRTISSLDYVAGQLESAANMVRETRKQASTDLDG